MTPKTTVWITFFATIAFAIGPYFASPFSGYPDSVFQFPQRDPAIQPAGYAFAIWGLVYLWLIVSAIFAVINRANDPHWARIQFWIIPSYFIGAAWTWIANHSAIWGTVTIWIMLAFALKAAILAPHHHDKWLLKAPLSLLAGWLSAASFVSLCVTLPGFGIGFDADTWAIIGLIAATLLTTFMQLKIGFMPTYGAAVIWAFIAIIVDNSQNIAYVNGVSFIGAAIITATLLYTIKRTD